MFPGGSDIDAMIRNKLVDFKDHINSLVDSVRNIDGIQEDLKKIPMPNRLIIAQKIQKTYWQYLSLVHHN